MRTPLFFLFVAVCVLADNDNNNRHLKLPYIADAIGNTLRPPSNVPATVGSPVNLLTPDRYEFYTFDESGELVKRLMTLEEIQAIVAAGEESEGLVTFANDNKPTIAFNFSQPSYNKVHSVVENVQNVLKAQMEAQKNKLETRPTLDTPDVSDTWSLILPSIFGNTGADIVPDKSSDTLTSDTDMLEIDNVPELDIGNEIPFSKEGNNQISSSKMPEQDITTHVTEKIPITTSGPLNFLTASSTTLMPVSTKNTISTTTNTPKIITPSTAKFSLTSKPPAATTIAVGTTFSTSFSELPLTTITTTKLKTTSSIASIATTMKPKSSTKMQTTTNKHQLTTTPVTLIKQNFSTTETSFLTTEAGSTKFVSTTTSAPSSTTSTTKLENKETIKTETLQNNYTVGESLTTNIPSVNNDKTQYEKISTFKPISTFSYVVESTTKKPTDVPNTTITVSNKINTNNINTVLKPNQNMSSPPTNVFKDESSIVADKLSTISSNIVSTSQFVEENKKNNTSLNTATLNPSSTEPISTEKWQLFEVSSDSKTDNYQDVNDEAKDTEPLLPLFDVAQSISQIASDLGNYQPVPTITSLLNNTTNLNDLSLESKENFELDIPTDFKNDENNFVKISTIDPLVQSENVPLTKDYENKNGNKSKIETKTNTSSTSAKPLIDETLTESMDDLLSQVVNQTPHKIANIEKKHNNNNKVVLYNQEKNKTVNSTSIKLSIAEENENEIRLKPTTANIRNFTQHISSDNIKNKLTISPLKQNVSEASSNKNVNKTLVSVHKNKAEVKHESVSSKTEAKINNVSSSKQENPVMNHKVDELVKISSAKPSENKTSYNSANQNGKHEMTNILNQPETSTVNDFIIQSGKRDSENMNGTSGAMNKINFTDLLPKVEEFKKKIQKVNIDDKELANERNNSWKLISTVSPPNGVSNKSKNENHLVSDNDNKNIVLEFPNENQGLEVTTKDLGEDMLQFTELCNELAFRYWNAIAENLDKRRSFVLSPYSITSMLAMMFMGARGATSGEMNEILKLDDMVTFNPHFTLKNISDSIEISPEAGVAVSGFVRELYSDRNKGKVLTFYKERAQHFYNGHVEEVNFDIISDIIRRRTNLLVKRYTWGKITEYMKANTITLQPPLASFSANIFQTDCTGTSVDGRDGEMYFVVSPNVRQRRLVPVPAVVYKKDFLAGYDPVLDATAAALGTTNSIVSTLFLMPGQQGNVVHAKDLDALEKRLLNTNPTSPTWNRILRTLLPRMGLELQIPKFAHKSVFNISSTLRKMGLKDIFDAGHADLGGLNGPSKDLYLSDMIQTSSFVTCGEGVVGEQHHIEEYPESVEVNRRRRTSRWADWDEPIDYQRAFHDPHDVGDAMHLPLHLRPRQARLPAREAQPARLKFDRPFLYFVRHNLSGMILYFGRYNPRLLP